MLTKQLYDNNINHIFPGEFNRPCDVAICRDTGRVMVTDIDNSRIQILDNQLKHIQDITRDGDGNALSGPARVCMNNEGDMIISDHGSNRVLVYDKMDLYSRDLPGPWSGPAGIAVDADDHIYICDTKKYSIKVLDKDGKVIRTFGSQGKSPGSFSNKPCNIIVFGDQLVISDTGGRICYFTKNGEFIKNLESGIVKASGLTVSPTGDLIMVDMEGEVVVLRDGRAVCRVGETGGESWHLVKPSGVAVTNTGQIVVANWGKHNLLIFDMIKKIYIH